VPESICDNARSPSAPENAMSTPDAYGTLPLVGTGPRQPASGSSTARTAASVPGTTAAVLYDYVSEERDELSIVAGEV